ncbi:MAG: MBL fold metallo-hydrolase, partial [Pseudomonadota bacterium]
MKKLAFLLIGLLSALASPAMSGEIKDSESATHGSDSSRYRIVDTYAFPGFKVIQFTLPVLSVYSYLLVSNGEGLLVDPVRDIAFYLETAKKEGVKITGVYLTHSHADFVAGHTEMKKALNTTIYQSHKSGAEYSIRAV